LFKDRIYVKNDYLTTTLAVFWKLATKNLWEEGIGMVAKKIILKTDLLNPLMNYSVNYPQFIEK
jgi:hypothetical protein